MDECLSSVLTQTYSSWECIIVNDGSTDKTEKIADLWLQKDPRFRYIFQENSGLSAARNTGINAAVGDWILPLDCDDKISENYLELAAKNFAQNPCIIYCDAEYFGVRSGKISLKPYDFRSLLIKNLIFCSAFFRKEDWQKAGGYDENMHDGLEDWDFWISLMKTSSKTVLKIPETCFYYRVKEKSMLGDLLQNSKKLAAIQAYIFQKHANAYLRTFPDFVTILNENRDLENELSFYKKSLPHRVLFKLQKTWKK